MWPVVLNGDVDGAGDRLVTTIRHAHSERIGVVLRLIHSSIEEMVIGFGLSIGIFDCYVIAILGCRGSQSTVLAVYACLWSRCPLAALIPQGQRVPFARDGDDTILVLAVKVDSKAADVLSGAAVHIGRDHSRTYRPIGKIGFISLERSINRIATLNRRIPILTNLQRYAIGILIAILGNQSYFLLERVVHF